MHKILFVISVFLLGHSQIIAQLNDYKYGKVSKEELEEKQHPLDPNAGAAVLYHSAHLTMSYDRGFWYHLEIKKRIKIYNKLGYDKAIIDLPFYYGTATKDRENITKIKAETYNLVDGKEQSERIKNSDIFEEEINTNWHTKKFTLPNIQDGSIIEFTYTYTSPHINQLPRFNFQEDIPVNQVFYQVEVPEFIGYKELYRGFHKIDRESKQYDGELPGYGLSKITTYKYLAQAVPKLKDEPMVNNLENFRTSIEHELSFLVLPGNAQPQQITTTWEAIATNLQKSEKFGQELDRAKYFEEDIDEVLKQSLDPVQRIYNIHNYVKNRMKWNKKYGIFSSGNLKRSYQEQTGSVADINLMLTAMLRYAGFYANPVLVSTRSNGIPISVTTAGFNYVVCAVKHQEQFILLDATSPYSLPDILPERSLNWFGRMIDPNGFSEQIDFMPSTVSNQRINLSYSIDESGKVSGKYRCQYDNHLALKYRINFTDANKESYVSFMENNYKGVNIEEYKEENVKDLSRPVMESFSFTTDEAIDVVDDKLFIKPLLFLSQEENPFKQDERAFPIDFTYPVTSRFLITIKIPEGYKVDWIPESTTLALPNNAGSFAYQCQQSGNSIQLSVTRSINSPVLPESYYAAIKELYNQVVEKETESIVLIKT